MIGEQDPPTEAIGPVRTRERRTVKAVAALTIVVLAVLGFASYKFVAGVGHTSKTVASRRTAVVTNTPSTQPASPAASSPAASASPAPVPVRTLKPVSAAAFGPNGTTDGDGAQQAGYAIDGSMVTDWRTDWYATPQLGGLQAGTGLLVDMGTPMTITGVQVTLGSASGANLQIRAGNTAALASLPQVAGATAAGGTVQLPLANPVPARYVLLWFTSLPPDGVGTYQAQVYNVSVTGHP